MQFKVLWPAEMGADSFVSTFLRFLPGSRTVLQRRCQKK